MSRTVTLRRLFNRITEEGAFGDSEFITSLFEDDSDVGTQFVSTVFFVKAHVAQKGVLKDIPVVVKVQSGNEKMLTSGSLSDMFNNEVIMYKIIIPLLRANHIDMFPVCFFCHARDGANFENGVLVLEDLRSKGFISLNTIQLFDLPHLLLAVRKLGEFHGLSYRYKEENYGQENQLKNKLEPTKYSKDWLVQVQPILLRFANNYKDVLVCDGYDKAQFDHLIKMIRDDFEYLVNFVTKPDEPFAVICHGDFKRNNMFFKYDSDGKPTDVKFFDLQNSVYSDPSLELSFFLYANVTSETRQGHWDELLDVYWKGVVTTAPRPGFSKAAFFANFTEKAFAGFFIASLFLSPSNCDEDMIGSNGTSDVHRTALDRSEEIQDAFRHAIDKNYLKKISEHHKQAKTWCTGRQE